MEKTVVLKNCRNGLGMKICGGQNDDGTYTGIFVKRILLGGAIASDGSLQEGDEILPVNGESLQHCSNDKAVALLRNASQTGLVRIAYHRDNEPRARLEKLFPSTTDSIYAIMRHHTGENHVTNKSLSRSDSVSSRLSTTSLEKRAWVYDGEHMSPSPLREPKIQADFMERDGLTRMEALDLPLSPRDMEQRPSDVGGRIRAVDLQKIKDGPTNLERVSSFDSGFPSSGRYPSPDLAEKELIDSMPVIKIEIPARNNLGISITGGKNMPDGPHVCVKEVIEGCDAYMDGRIRKGDRIVAINNESFTDVTYEQARSILLRLKLQVGNSRSSAGVSFQALEVWNDMLAELHELPTLNSFKKQLKTYLKGQTQKEDQRSFIGKDLSSYRIRYIVNPDHVAPLKPLPALLPPSVNPKIEKVPEQSHSHAAHSSGIHQSYTQNASPNGAESTVSRSSDEEAVIKELMKMMEDSNEYESQLVDSSLLALSNGSRSGQSIAHHITPQSPTNQHRPLLIENQAQYFIPGGKDADGSKEYQRPLGMNERKTISQYLEEDLNASYSPKSTQSTSKQSRAIRRRERGRRLSLDPMTRIKVEKLEVALNYLGFDTTPANIQDVRKRLKIDRNGSVTYGDFVSAAKDVFGLRLDDHTRTLNASTLQFAVRDIEDMSPADVEKKTRQQQVDNQSQQQVPTEPVNGALTRMSLKDIEAIEEEELKMIASRESQRFAEMQASNRRIQDDLARVARERDEVIRELQYLKRQVNEQNLSNSDIEEQLGRSRQEASNAYREVSELRTRTHLVSTALQEAKQRERQYEETIEKLKQDIENGKSRNNNIGPKQREFNELQKRLVVLGCQLRKTEVSKRTYEVAVEKLTKFAQRVQDLAENERNSSRPNSRNSSVKKLKAPASPATEILSQEARDTIKAVKILLEEEPLPFGWEEVYSSDGTRYYINHVTQTTSWLHPVSGVQHAGVAENGIAPPPTDQKF